MRNDNDGGTVMTNIQQQQRERINAHSGAASKPGFVPPSPYEELEAARAAHESAVEQYKGRQARRQQVAAEEARLKETLDAIHQAKRETEAEATAAVKRSAIKALRVVAEHGESWLAQIEAERAAALAECDELRAALADAEARARKDDKMEAWLRQALSEASPRAFTDVAERVAS